MLFKSKSTKLELLIEKIQSLPPRDGGIKDLSIGACSSLWEGVSSEEGRGGSATPTSSEEGRDIISGTSASDVEASSTVGVTEGTPYQCTFCDLAFPRLSYLKKHEQTHADQLPFRCDFCGRHFKHKRSRDRHVKLHTGDKKYKCNHCEAAFSRSDHLKIHLKTHDSQKPYRCTICTRGYSTAAALTAHMQNHKSNPPGPIDHLLKNVSGCDPSSLITRLIQDSAVSGVRQKEAETNNVQTSEHQNSSFASPTKPTSPLSDLGQKSSSPNTTVKCHICRTHCRSQAHLQSHLSRHHREEVISPQERAMDIQPSGSFSVAVKSEGFSDRPPSASNHSGSSSYGAGKPEVSPTASSPLSRPASALTSPHPLNLSTNPFLTLVGGKLICPFCNNDGFPSFESFQLHIQSVHGSAINGDILGLPSPLSSFRSSGLFPPLMSSLGSPGSSRQVTCELCGARVSGIGALQRHVITAHSFTDLLARVAEGVFCAQCLLPFSNPGALSEHIKLVHSTSSPSLVPTLSLLSGALSKRPSSPIRDAPTDLSKKPRRDGASSLRDLPSSTLLCSQCDAPFADFESFRAHLKTHLDGTESEAAFTCPECHAHVGSEISLESHLANHLEVTSTEYGCPACLKTFSKPDELQKHLLDMHAHHLYRCALCRQVFDSKVSIQVHFAVKHSNETKIHKCVKCNLKFRTQTEFDSHLRETHLPHGRDLVQTVNGMISPHSDIHSQISPFKLNHNTCGSYRCLLCPATLSTEAEMSSHLATHERQFRCSLCNEAFHVEFLLDRHVQAMHAKELNGSHQPDPQKPSLSPPNRRLGTSEVRCGICDIHFTSESSLNAHRKQVHNIKSASNKVAAATLSLFCAYCSEVCKSRNDLEAHMKATHVGSGGGRHKCNICDEIYPSASTLAQHKLSHVKVLSGGTHCVICREALSSAEQIKAHQSDHHMQSLPQPCVVCRQTLVAEVEIKVHAQFHASQMASSPIASDVENDYRNTYASETTSTSSVKLPIKCPDCHVKIETVGEAHMHTCHKKTNGNNLDTKEWKDKMAMLENKEIERLTKGKKGDTVNLDHFESQTGRTYQCIKCQESFDSESAIEAHVASHLEQEGSSHLCHLCRTCFDTPLRLQCHLIEHTFEGCGSFSCYLCASVYTTAARLQQHMVTHGLSAKPYDCHHCRQSFFFRSELENHLPNHYEAANGCHDCQITYPARIRTRNSSSESGGFSCPSCPHVSLTTGEQLSHSLQHKHQSLEGPTTPQPGNGSHVSVDGETECAVHVCKTCSKKCRSAKSLHLHNLTHEGGKPYLCCECGAAFTRRCEASRHCFHQKEKATKLCCVCQKEFKSSSDIFLHLQEEHTGSDAEIVRPESRCSSCDGELDNSDSSPIIS